MDNPVVSIITPTGITPLGTRSHLLPKIYESVRKQTFLNFEWLILDDGPALTGLPAWSSDARVRYEHRAGGKMKLGAKRNELCELAKGEIVAMFDDDDYYAPHYLDQMLALLNSNKVDFAKLYGFQEEGLGGVQISAR
jgi:glycosyltransferase involved in cell wall biosynthesis